MTTTTWHASESNHPLAMFLTFTVHQGQVAVHLVNILHELRRLYTLPSCPLLAERMSTQQLM